MTIDQELRAAADELLEVIGHSPVPPVPDPQPGDDLTVDYLRQAERRTTVSESTGWIGVVIAVAATILVVVGVIVVADGTGGDVATQQVASPVVADTVPSPDVGDPVGSPDVVDPPVDAEDDGLGTEPQLFLVGLATPNDVEVDPSGGLFVSETEGRRVVRVAILPDGSAGESVVVASDIGDAEGLALDATGVLYISGSSSVYRVADAITTRLVGGFNDPEGLAIDANGDLYVADDAESGIRITKVTVGNGGDVGTVTEVAIVPGETAADIEFGPTGELFVANRVDEVWAVSFTEDESVTSRPYAVIPGGPAALAFDPAGTLYVGTDSDQRGAVWSVEPAGAPRMIAAAATHVEGVALDASGTLYLTNVGENEVLRIGTNELISPPGVADPVPPLWPLTFRDPAVRSEMSGVVAWGPGFVAVGRQAVCTDQEVDGKEDLDTCDGEDRAAVWTSVDGITWLRVPHDDSVFGGAGMESVTAGGPGLVAVGGNEGGSVVWTSVDGFTWSRVAHDDAVFGGAGMGSVTVGGPGLVAVGTAEAGFGDGEDDKDAAVWTSIDGLTWSRVPHDETTFGGADNQSMWSVTAGGPGLVAVGRDGQGPWDNSRGQDAAVWTSVDGLTWSRVPHDEDAFGGGSPAMFSVTAGGPGLVAVGFSIRSWSAAVWTSVDGLAWSRVAHDNGVDLSGTMRSVTAGGPGLIAVGAAAVWTSPDGLTWSRVANGGEAEPATYSKMLDVSAANGRLVAVGRLDGRSTPGPDPPHEEPAAVWTSPNP